ncbi:hypothetical protein GNX71_32100 [Variovorax sp. RKNM96]|uniref:hypothetical protein n=1 Tax=Variovorax sp. RKNM96 TaxID=2681552 RepID=UPI001981330A|nr:hypothetical protein [Variovorax sp. RKNM96]QSI33962.1 hypothetical protein GNX71_32100 [Variovorax sp. RKNM96]
MNKNPQFERQRSRDFDATRQSVASIGSGSIRADTASGIERKPSVFLSSLGASRREDRNGTVTCHGSGIRARCTKLPNIQNLHGRMFFLSHLDVFRSFDNVRHLFGKT